MKLSFFKVMRLIDKKVILNLFLGILIFCVSCSKVSNYDPYNKPRQRAKPDYPGRVENRLYSEDQYTTPGKTIMEENQFKEKILPASAKKEPVKDPFDFTNVSYLLGPGDILEVIYQLKAVKRNESYKIKIQDELDVTFYYTSKLNRRVTVRTDGYISLPLVGDIEVFGRTTSEVQKDLVSKYANILKEPVIEVTVAKSNWAIEELKRAITTAPRGQSRMEPIRPDGCISLPLIGDVLLGGKTVSEAGDAIVQKYMDLGVMDIDVTVVLLEVKSPIAYVMGDVLKPGPVVISENIDVWRTISLAGGFTTEADKKHIVVAKTSVNEGEKRFVLDFDKWKSSLDGTENTAIRRGDIIYVPKIKDRYVYILGAVEKPGRVELDGEQAMTASQVVAMGGRIKAGANEGQVLILRRSPENDPIVIEANLKQVFNPDNYDSKKDYPPRDPYVQPGDIVFVPTKFIGDINRFAEAYFKDGIWTIVPFGVNVSYTHSF